MEHALPREEAAEGQAIESSGQLAVSPDLDRVGVLAAVLRHGRFQRRVHMRQGLLALAQGQPIYENYTLRLLRKAGLAHPDGVATEAGKARAAKALRDEKRWELVRADQAFESAAALYDGLREIETVLTVDQIAEIDTRIGGPKGMTA